MPIRRSALLTSVLTVITVGCSTAQPTPQVAAGALEPAASAMVSSAPPTSSSTSVSVVPEGPKINWDAPLSHAKWTSATAAAKDGALTFAPRTPRFPNAPAAVQVSDPAATAVADRAVVYLYKFPLGADFPTDGRIRVLEYATTSSEADLEGVAKNPPGPAEDFAVITIAGHLGLLVQAHGVGRIQYIQNGVMYDVTGPSAPTAVVKKLAAEL